MAQDGDRDNELFLLTAATLKAHAQVHKWEALLGKLLYRRRLQVCNDTTLKTHVLLHKWPQMIDRLIHRQGHLQRQVRRWIYRLPEKHDAVPIQPATTTPFAQVLHIHKAEEKLGSPGPAALDK